MKALALRVFVGTVAALLAWTIMEPLAPKTIGDPSWEMWEGQFMAVLGGLIGASIGGINGYLTGGKVHTLRGLVLGLVFGVAGIALGAKIGMLLVAVTFGQDVFTSQQVIPTILARTLALTPIGGVLGAAIGASSLSVKRIKLGLIGGLMGGAIGGASFDIVGSLVASAVASAKGVGPNQIAEVGGTSRAVYAIALGLGIALFIGIVESLAKNAWVRQVLGRNEGREWPLYGQHTIIGRSENATIPIFGDPTLQPHHATISNQGGTYYITDGGGGVLINGQPVQQAPLFSGANIQLGQTVLQFLMKEGRMPAMGPEAYGTPAYPMGGPQPGYQPQPTYQPAPGVQASQPTTMAPVQSSQPTVMTPMPSSQPTIMTPAQPMGMTLVATDGPLTGQRYPVGQPFEVGRDCPAIPMAFDTSVSRRHALIAPSPGGVSVNDLGSTNGVFINGQRVTAGLLTPGSILKIGATTFRIE